MNNFQFKGQVQLITPEQSGLAKSTGNEWSKQEVVLVDVSGKYAKKIVIEAFNKRDEMSKIKPGQTVIAHFNTDASEYNGRWYGKNTLWKFEFPGESAPEQSSNDGDWNAPQGDSYPKSFPPVQTPAMNSQQSEPEADGLPF